MKAMLFCAGLGTRLFPITRDVPKALAPFLEGTLLSYNLQFLAAQGITHFVINTHHFADKIKVYLEDNGYFNLDIRLSYEPILMDTAGGLAAARKFFLPDTEPILLYNVDVISGLSIRSFLAYHRSSGSAVSLAVRERESSRYLIFDSRFRLRGWENRHTGQKILSPNLSAGVKNLAFSGIHFIQPEILDMLEPGRIYSLVDVYLERMDTMPIHGYRHDADYWFDCGKPERLAAAENFIRRSTDR